MNRDAFFADAAECPRAQSESNGVAGAFSAPREFQKHDFLDFVRYLVGRKNCVVSTEPELRNRGDDSISRQASQQALAEAHAEIARLTAECDRVKEELKEALVGVCYGRMCEKELLALRARMKI